MIKAGVLVSFGLLLGRLSGLLREVMIASTFGASTEADIVILALLIPDLLVNVLMAGAFSAALIPEFKKLGQPRAAGLLIQVSIATALVFVVLAILASVFSGWLVLAFAPGLEAAAMTQAAELVGITVWLIPLTCLAAVTRAYLQAHGRFGIESMGTLIYNCAVITGLALVAAQYGELRLICAFVILGGLLRWGSQLTVLPRPLNVMLALRGRLIERKLMVRIVQASSAGGLLLFLPVIARALASYDGAGAIASFNYAIKLTEFALGVMITVLAVAIYPKLAEHFENKDEVRFRQLLKDGVWWLLLLALATTVPMLWFCPEFVGLAFGWGRMNDSALMSVSTLMMIGLFGLPLHGLISLMTAAANARRDTAGPLRANAIAVLVFLPLGALMRSEFGLSGIMSALVLSYLLATAIQLVFMSRHHGLDVYRMLFSPEALKTLVLVVLTCSTVGVLGRHTESALAGVLMAVASGGIAITVRMAASEQYRAMLRGAVRRAAR